MAGRFDLIKDLNDNSQKFWRLKVRIIRLWSVPNFQDKSKEPMLEMVFLDEQSNRIQCSISSQHVKLFKELLFEGKVYLISNISVASNLIKYKATQHPFRLFFRKNTKVKVTEDLTIPLNAFKFVPNSVIAKEPDQESHLVDVIGVVTSRAKNLKYTVVMLDDLESEENLKCTLWDPFAEQLMTYMDQNPQSQCILILQFGKMKNYQGLMEVSNTKYISRLFINADFSEIADFKHRLAKIDSPTRTKVTQFVSEPIHSMEDDFFTLNIYKTISELRQCQEKGIFVTIGTVNDIENQGNWWYKGCKKCLHGLRQDTQSFHCKKCDSYPTTFIPRYSIHLTVEDETGCASFMLYDKEAFKFLNKSANDLRAEYISRGGDKSKYPEEINAFKGNKFLFKVSVRVEDLNSFQPSVIKILKLCSNDAIINSFIHKYKIDKDSLSQSCQTAIPSKAESEVGWVAKPSDACLDDFCLPPIKLRKIIKQEKD